MNGQHIVGWTQEEIAPLFQTRPLELFFKRTDVVVPSDDDLMTAEMEKIEAIEDEED